MPDNNKPDNKKTKQVVNDSVAFFNSLTDDHIQDPKYVPESIQPYIANFVRKGRSKFDVLNSELYKHEKSSDNYVILRGQIEGVAKSFINAKSQTESYKKHQGGFRDIMNEINPGTLDDNYYKVATILGNQWDTMAIDDDGYFYFGYTRDKAGKKMEYVPLNKLASTAPILTEPYNNKKFVFDLANRTKESRDKNFPFDEEWVYKTTLDQFSSSTPGQIVATAFTDLAGDGRTKTFAELYMQGLGDKLLYTNPETGEKLPRKDTQWMKDTNNSGILSQLLSKFVTGVMKDIYGSVKMEQPYISPTSLSGAQKPETKTKYYENYFSKLNDMDFFKDRKISPADLLRKYSK